MYLSDYIVNKYKNRKIIKNIINLPLYGLTWFIFIPITFFLKPCSCKTPKLGNTIITNTFGCSKCLRLFDFSDTPRLLELMSRDPSIIYKIPKKYKNNPEIELFIKVHTQ
jgi:hypothetical protein